MSTRMKEMQSKRKIASVTIRLEQLAKRRHGDADEDERCDRARALRAKPCQCAHGQGENLEKNGSHSVWLVINLRRDHAVFAARHKSHRVTDWSMH